MTAGFVSISGIWHGVATTATTFGALAPGDVIYLPDGTGPVRVRYVDRYPNGKTALFAGSATDIEFAEPTPFGLFNTADAVQRVTF